MKHRKQKIQALASKQCYSAVNPWGNKPKAKPIRDPQMLSSEGRCQPDRKEDGGEKGRSHWRKEASNTAA